MDRSRVLWRSVGNNKTAIPADGCVDLILRGDELWVAGPSTTWFTSTDDGEAGALGIRHVPGAARGLLGIALADVTDQVVAARDVLPHDRAARLRDQFLWSRDTWPIAPRLRMLGGDSIDSSWSETVRWHARRGTTAVRLAEVLRWSERTFRRRMLAAFGYPYPTLVRIERSHRARALLGNGASLVEAATLAGYADQPHLSREFRRLVGASPGQFAASSA